MSRSDYVQALEAVAGAARDLLENMRGGENYRWDLYPDTHTFLDALVRAIDRLAALNKPAEDAPKIAPIACDKCGHYVANEPHTVYALCRRCDEPDAEDAPQEQEGVA